MGISYATRSFLKQKDSQGASSDTALLRRLCVSRLFRIVVRNKRGVVVLLDSVLS
jgi:hypothetical protein